METNEIKYIPMYKSYIDAVAKLPSQDRVIIYEAIFEYGFTGKEPEFDNPYLQMGWELVKPNLVNNINNMLKQSKNGKKGGRPSKSKNKSNDDLKTIEKITNESKVDNEVKKTEQPIKKEPVPYPNLEEEESFIPNEEDSVKSIYDNNNTDLESALTNSNINNDDEETTGSFNIKNVLLKICDNKEKVDKLMPLIDPDSNTDVDDLYETLISFSSPIRKQLKDSKLELSINESTKLYNIKINNVTEPELQYN